MFLGVRFSVAGLDRTKFSFSQLQSQIKNTGMVSKTLLRNTLRLHNLSLHSKCFRISLLRSESWDKSKKKSNEEAGERGKHLSANPTILKNPICLPNAKSATQPFLVSSCNAPPD